MGDREITLLLNQLQGGGSGRVDWGDGGGKVGSVGREVGGGWRGRGGGLGYLWINPDGHGASVQGGRPPNPADTFCLVKTYMHDAQLQQPPLMVLPAEFRTRVTTYHPATLRPRTALTRIEVDNLQKMVRLLSRPITFYPRAVEYFRTLLSFTDNQAVQMPVLTWLQRDRPPPTPVQIPTGNEHYDHLPQTSWRMTVKLKW